MGVLINAGAIAVGGLIGLLLKNILNEKVVKVIFQALGLSVLSAGILDLISGINSLSSISFNYGTLFLVLVLVVGGLIGSLLKISERLDKFGSFLQKKLAKSEDSKLGKGFVETTLITCVGAMVVYGSIKSGLGDDNTLYIKSILDGVIAIMLGTKYGFGPVLSAIPVLIIQGAFFFIGMFFSSYILNTAFYYLLTSAGGVLVMGIGINLLEIKEIKTADLLPAIPLCLLAFLF